MLFDRQRSAIESLGFGGVQAGIFDGCEIFEAEG
jgi:hypothetical protein